MIHYRIDAGYFMPILKFIPRDIIFEIVAYGYNKCADCRHYVTREYTCSCGVIRCEYDSMLNVRLYTCVSCHLTPPANITLNHRTRILCIIEECDMNAEYGYKDIICYCYKHAYGKKKVICYQECDSCYLRTPYINILTKNPHCILHRYNMESYELKYII